MADTTFTALPVEEIPLRASRLSILWGFCRRNPLGAIGAVIVIAMIIMAAGAEILSSYDPLANDFGAMLAPPNALPLVQALDAIREADLILMGPGSLYTSILPNLLIPEITLAIARSWAPRVPDLKHTLTVCPGRHVIARATTPRSWRANGPDSGGTSRVSCPPGPEGSDARQDGKAKPFWAEAGLARAIMAGTAHRAKDRKRMK